MIETVSTGRALDDQQVGCKSFLLAPICGVSDSGGLLYAECLGTSSYGGLQWPRASERFSQSGLGSLTRAFDHHVLRKVLGLLQVQPDLRLGVNVSVPVTDPFWDVAFAELFDQPDVAARLTIEIPESARFPVEAGRQFVRRLQQLGCRIAIDGFGAAYGVEVAMVVHEPDIVKLDASLLDAAGQSKAGARRLERMVALAGSVGREVVVMGVRDERCADIVRRSGASWLQRVAAAVC